MNNQISKKSALSLSKALLVFYVLIASQFTGDLMGKQLRTFIEENRIAKHIIGFILMAVLINIIGEINAIDKIMFYSLLGYVWFILTTKLDIQWNLIIILLLLSGFIYENILAEKEQISQTDQVLTNEEKTNIVEHDTQNKIYVVLGIFFVTIIGTSLYLNKKNVQYGGGFDMTTFLLY